MISTAAIVYFTRRKSMEYDNGNWIWEGIYYCTHLFGGVMLTAAVVGISNNYFGGTGVPILHYLWPCLAIFPKKKKTKKRTRVYMDGCFDLMHYGHANALRQAKALGDELVVGVVSDEEIMINKGPPVLPMDERLALVSGLKWVDEVIEAAPYAINEEFMKKLFGEYRIDYIIHGDDPCLLPDGTDAYALAKIAGRYKQIKRTEGVSSTDIVGRILSSAGCKGTLEKPKGTYDFLPTSRRIVQFSDARAPAPNARVVYIDGGFDLFHAGHVEILRTARQLGDFLLVGVYSDDTVSEVRRNSAYPIMHLHERCLSVLACRYVDDVIFGAPWEVSSDMVTTFNVSLVVSGTVAETDDGGDPYAFPRSIGIFRRLQSPKNITTTTLCRRIIANHEAYTKRNAKKSDSELKYYAGKKYVPGE